MTNKEIKELVGTIEHTLVSKQNEVQRSRFNLKLYKDKIELLEAKLLARDEKIESLKKEFGLLCKSIKDESIERDLLIAYSNSYIDSQKLK